jgi:hypothetical protein
MSQRQPPRQLEDAEKDLKAAEAEHARLSQAWESYSGKNANSYRSAPEPRQEGSDACVRWSRDFARKRAHLLPAALRP